jgi:hypothetical protein
LREKLQEKKRQAASYKIQATRYKLQETSYQQPTFSAAVHQKTIATYGTLGTPPIQTSNQLTSNNQLFLYCSPGDYCHMWDSGSSLRLQISCIQAGRKLAVHLHIAVKIFSSLLYNDHQTLG